MIQAAVVLKISFGREMQILDHGTMA